MATCRSRRWSFVGAERRLLGVGEEREGTKCLLRCHDEIPDTLQSLLTLPRGDVHRDTPSPLCRRRRRDCLRGLVCAQKNVRGDVLARGTFTTRVAERIALTRKKPEAVPHEEEYWLEPLVNNVAFNIVIYGIARTRFEKQTA